MKKIISLLGIGPKLVLSTFLFSFLLETVIGHYHFEFTFKFIPYYLLAIIGTLLIIVGVLLLVPSFIAISKLRKVDSLYTKGVYSICRHPLYSSWIIFIVPGMILLLNSLILLTIPLVMYFIFMILIKDEETFLLNKYGDQYHEYKNQVGLIFPMIWKYKNEHLSQHKP